MANSWNILNLHFKLIFGGGYRYLDRCGEFMIRAERELEFLPAEAQPKGATMTIPEKSINLALDSSAVALQQHQPTADETGEFRDLCEAVSKLAMEIFEPTNTQRTGIACTSVRSFSSDEAVLKASRAVVAANGSTPISEWIDMPLSQVELNERYRSGSRELVVRTQPVTFVNRPLATGH